MKHISLLFTLFIVLTLNAQNITIDYQAWNPSNPPCNVFAYATNVPATGATSGVIEHQTKLGQPSYNSSIQAIQMPTNYVSSSS